MRTKGCSCGEFATRLSASPPVDAVASRLQCRHAVATWENIIVFYFRVVSRLDVNVDAWMGVGVYDQKVGENLCILLDPKATDNLKVGQSIT